MISGYVKQIKTSIATGDVTLPIEVIKEQLEKCAKLNLQKVVILTEEEFLAITEKMTELQEMVDMYRGSA